MSFQAVSKWETEKCFAIQNPPRITDGLHSLAQPHELLEDYAAAIDDRERIIRCLREEHNTVSGEGINSQKREIERLKGLSLSHEGNTRCSTSH